MAQGRPAELDSSSPDLEPVTPFSVVAEHGLLRLRQYLPEAPLTGQPPVLLVYPMIKRPTVLDLVRERSVVRNLLGQGFSVYLTDWVPPQIRDSERGFDDYVNQDLAHAVDAIRELEDVSRVSLIGCCCAGLLCAIHAAVRPETVAHLVTLATPFAAEPPLAPMAAAQIVLACGNVPAWLVASILNARMQDRRETELRLAQDFGEDELACPEHDAEGRRLLDALGSWLVSDVPLAGRLFLEFVCEALPGAALLEGRMQVGGQRVRFGNIDCPVLSIAGERDTVVPPAQTEGLVSRVGSREAISLVFPSGHLGLMLGRSAHQRLWPEIGAWLATRRAAPRSEAA